MIRLKLNLIKMISFILCLVIIASLIPIQINANEVDIRDGQGNPNSITGGPGLRWRSFRSVPNGASAFTQVYQTMVNHRNSPQPNFPNGWGIHGWSPAQSEGSYAAWLTNVMGNGLGGFCQTSDVIYVLTNAELYNSRILIAGVLASSGGWNLGVSTTSGISWSHGTSTTAANSPQHHFARSSTSAIFEFNMWDSVFQHSGWSGRHSVIWCSDAVRPPPEITLTEPTSTLRCSGTYRWVRSPEHDEHWNFGVSASGRLGWKQDLYAQNPSNGISSFNNLRQHQLSSPSGINRCENRPNNGWCSTPLQEWLNQASWNALTTAINDPNRTNSQLNAAVNTFQTGLDAAIVASHFSLPPHFDLTEQTQNAIQKGALYEIITSDRHMNFSWNLRRTRTQHREQCLWHSFTTCNRCRENQFAIVASSNCRTVQYAIILQNCRGHFRVLYSVMDKIL
ncbi:MAG: hypothetical protein LBC73_10475 [Oscillospiraceae bacterium]|nr:hypothetical protein [Oscillospiraceae bacterium]